MWSPFLFVNYVATAVAVGSSSSLSGSGIPSYFEYHAHLLSPSSKCHDDSRATFYHRNCTANGDRKPFDPTDFCAGEQTWVIEFLGGSTQNASADAASGAFCFDTASCAARAARDSSLVSSKGLKPTLFAQGVTLPFPEVNPNLYKQHSVIVPYCTSDLWAGPLSGGLIAVDVIRALGAAPLIGDTGLRDADRVVLIGPAGIMVRLDELAEALRAAKRAASGNASATLEVLGVCDGCLLPILPPPAASPATASVAPGCTTDADCPPARALPLLADYFNISSAPSGCHISAGRPVWECFTADALVESLGAARTPALLIAQQYDARVAASYGEESQGAWAATRLAPALRALVAATPQTVFGVAPACGAPAQLTPTAALFDTKVAHNNSYVIINATIISGFTTFLEAAAEGGGGKTEFGTWVDSCDGYNCLGLCPS